MRWLIVLVLLLLIFLAKPLKSQESTTIDINLKKAQPTIESDSIREMRAFYGSTIKTARMKVRVIQSGNNLAYSVLSQDGPDIIRKRVFLDTLENEKKKLREGVFDSSGFNTENYKLSLLEKKENYSLVRIIPRKRPGFLLDGHALLNGDGVVIYSDGRLANSPSFWVKDTFVSITFQMFNGSRVPIHLESTGKIRMTGMKSFLSIKYTYNSINGVKIDN